MLAISAYFHTVSLFLVSKGWQPCYCSNWLKIVELRLLYSIRGNSIWLQKLFHWSGIKVRNQSIMAALF